MIAAPKPKRTLPVIYLSGPMSGHAEFNFPLFHGLAAKLRSLGFPVLNPADFGVNPSQTWEDCLKRDLTTLGHADVIVALPGFNQSRGAVLEIGVAVGLGKKVVTVGDGSLSDFVRGYFEPAALVAFVMDAVLRKNVPEGKLLSEYADAADDFGVENIGVFLFDDEIPDDEFDTPGDDAREPANWKSGPDRFALVAARPSFRAMHDPSDPID